MSIDKQCDGSVDCDEGEDEENCTLKQTITCNIPDEFECGTCCVPAISVCTDNVVCQCSAGGDDDTDYYGDGEYYNDGEADYYGDSEYYGDGNKTNFGVDCSTWNLTEYINENSGTQCWSSLYIILIAAFYFL